MNLRQFRASLEEPSPPAGLSGPVEALWYAARGDWQRAHTMVHDDPDAAATWVHAHLHRVEGDTANADYWYRQAGRTRPQGGEDEELWDIAAALLKGGEASG